MPDPIERLNVALQDRYRIERELGAGGMAIVYLANDLKHDRKVALKVLRPELGAVLGPERFLAEIRVTANLQHPHLLPLFDSGEADGLLYYVMPYVDGESLRAKLEREKELPVDEAVRIARAVASALDYAHRNGVVHRDLKPENILLHDGEPVVADFGIALAVSNAGGERLTRTGSSLGTPQYMSPEQATGDRPVDARADIYSLGAVVYEMLAGEPPHTGSTAQAMLAMALTERPRRLRTRRPAVPENVDSAVQRALERVPADRFPMPGEFSKALSDPTFRHGGDSAGLTQRAPLGARSRWAPAALGLLILGVGGLLGFLAATAGEPVAPAPVGAQRLTDFVGLEESPAISPDGRSVTFTATVEGRRQVFVRLIAGGAPLQLTVGPTDHENPRWSPESASILYFSRAAPGALEGDLWEVPALGGPPRRVASSLGGADVSGQHGRVAFFRLWDGQVELVTSEMDGSGLEVTARFTPAYYRHPRWSPDGEWIAFQQGDGTRVDLYVVAAGGGDPRRLTHDDTPLNGHDWLPDSRRIVFSSSRQSTTPYLPTFSLWEIRIADRRVRRLSSEDASYMHPDVHHDGRVAVSRMTMDSDIWEFPVQGLPEENVSRSRRVTRQTGHVLTPTAAPDGRRLAYLSDSGGQTNVWVLGVDDGELRQITFERDAAVGAPLWSPDGAAIAFVSARGSQGLAFGIWQVAPDGSRLRQLVERGFGAAWSADGRWVYYVERADGAVRKVPAGGGPSREVRPGPTRNVVGLHGSTLYFTVERPLVDGRAEVEIRRATPEEGRSEVLASIPASRLPSWQIVNPSLSPDGFLLAQALTDGYTTNLWTLSTSTGEWQQITDFGDQATFIARRVSWTHDGRAILAAVAEGDADIVLLDGLVPPQR